MSIILVFKDNAKVKTTSCRFFWKGSCRHVIPSLPLLFSSLVELHMCTCTQVWHHWRGMTPLVSHIVQRFHHWMPMWLSYTHCSLCSVLLRPSLYNKVVLVLNTPPVLCVYMSLCQKFVTKMEQFKLKINMRDQANWRYFWVVLDTGCWNLCTKRQLLMCFFQNLPIAF